jgi:hypothetical protein
MEGRLMHHDALKVRPRRQNLVNLTAICIVGLLSTGGIVISAMKPEEVASTWAALSPLILSLTYAAFGWKPTK